MKNNDFIRKETVKRYTKLSYIYMLLAVICLISAIFLISMVFWASSQILQISICSSTVILTIMEVFMFYPLYDKEYYKIKHHMAKLKMIKNMHYEKLVKNLIHNDEIDEAISFYEKFIHKKYPEYLIINGYIRAKLENTEYYNKFILI